MPPANVWPVERNVATCNWRPEPPRHLLLLLRLIKAVGRGVGVGIEMRRGISSLAVKRAKLPTIRITGSSQAAPHNLRPQQ